MGSTTRTVFVSVKMLSFHTILELGSTFSTLLRVSVRITVMMNILTRFFNITCNVLMCNSPFANNSVPFHSA